MNQRGVIAIAKVFFVAQLASSRLASSGMPLDIPETLKVSITQELSLEVQAIGVQIYECKANKVDPTRFEWTFKAPEAELFDQTGKKIGKHYAGPTWESNDGSQVVGEIKETYSSPDSNAIPWLLLSAKSTSGDGLFSKIQSIQRLNTMNGKAPAKGCSQARAGKETRVPYKARYYLVIRAKRNQKRV